MIVRLQLQLNKWRNDKIKLKDSTEATTSWYICKGRAHHTFHTKSPGNKTVKHDLTFYPQTNGHVVTSILVLFTQSSFVQNELTTPLR